MSDEPTAPFTFRPAPTKPPRRRTKEEIVNDATTTSDLGPVEYAAEPPKRKRRTRVEMAQAAIIDRASPSDNKMVVLTKCLKLLRLLSREDVTEAVNIITAVFK